MLKILVAVAIAWLIAQAITFTRGCIKNKGCILEYVYKSGDIISGHCASMASLVFIIFLYQGLSPLFAVTLVLSLIVWRDAKKRHTFSSIMRGIILGLIVSYITFLLYPL